MKVKDVIIGEKPAYLYIEKENRTLWINFLGTVLKEKYQNADVIKVSERKYETIIYILEGVS